MQRLFHIAKAYHDLSINASDLRLYFLQAASYTLIPVIQYLRMKYLFSFLFVLWLLPISVFAQQSEADILLDENAAQIEALERALEEQVPTLDGLPYPETHSEQVRAEVIDIVSDEVVDGFRQMVFICKCCTWMGR